MVKSIGKSKVNTAIFISGRGSNLNSLIKFSNKKKTPININLILSNKKNAKGINYAIKNNINYFIINYKNKKTAEKKILFFLNKYKVSLICLAGFMKILSKKFIKKFKGKILNIHPSLLPKYKGLNCHERVLKNKEKFTGCTVHYVSSQLDSGKIIMQKKVKIPKNYSINKLEKKVLKAEHNLYPKAILKILFKS